VRYLRREKQLKSGSRDGRWYQVFKGVCGS
jgi:hypothetical protein